MDTLWFQSLASTRQPRIHLSAKRWQGATSISKYKTCSTFAGSHKGERIHGQPFHFYTHSLSVNIHMFPNAPISVSSISN